MISFFVAATPRLRSLFLALVLYVTLFGVFALASLWAPWSENLVPVFLSAVVGSAVAIFWVWTFSQTRTDDAWLWRLITTGIAIDVVFNFCATKLWGVPGGSSVISLLASAFTGFGNIGVLMATMGVGLRVGRGLQKPNYLVMAAIVGALTDIFSVYAGPSNHIKISGAFFSYLSFQWGLIGHGSIDPIVGAGDFIFLALYFFGARKFGLNDRKTLWAMLLAIGAGFLVTLFVGSVPALPFMSMALLLAHGRELKAQMRIENQNS